MESATQLILLLGHLWVLSGFLVVVIDGIAMVVGKSSGNGGKG